MTAPAIARDTHAARSLGVPSLLQGASRVWRRDAVVYKHMAKWLLVPNFIDPVLFLVAFGLGLGSLFATVDGVRYIEFIAPGLIATSAMYTSSFESTWNIHFKIEQNGTYEAILAAPLGPRDIVVGEVMWSATRATISGVIFFVVTIAFGLVQSPWAALVPFVIVLVGANFGSLGLLAASYVLDLGFWGYYFTLIITPMFLLSGVFFPIERLPEWAQVVAQFMPTYHAAALLRSLYFGDLSIALLGHAAFLLVVPLILMPPAIARLGKRLTS